MTGVARSGDLVRNSIEVLDSTSGVLSKVVMSANTPSWLNAHRMSVHYMDQYKAFMKEDPLAGWNSLQMAAIEAVAAAEHCDGTPTEKGVVYRSAISIVLTLGEEVVADSIYDRAKRAGIPKELMDEIEIIRAHPPERVTTKTQRPKDYLVTTFGDPPTTVIANLQALSKAMKP